MMVVPIQAVPNQRVTVVLAGQPCTIDIQTRTTGLFMDLYVNNSLIIGGVVCEDRNRIVRDAYLGFIGDLAFFDTTAADGADPTYEGFGSQFLLVYLEAADLS